MRVDEEDDFEREGSVTGEAVTVPVGAVDRIDEEDEVEVVDEDLLVGFTVDEAL